MNKINLILNNKIFKDSLKKNEECEKNRKFCYHNIVHFLDVARIAYIINLEKNFKLEKNLIYAASLLHDIGRWRQYEEGIPHHIASAELANIILIQSDFNENEISIILEAIEDHRKKSVKRSKLSEIIYLSDKLSRNCFMCNSVKECNWSEESKNYKLTY